MRIAVLALALAGCGGPALTLDAHGVGDVSDAPGFSPESPGARLLRVELTLRNDSDRTLPLSAGLFRLDPSEGPSVVGAPISAELERSCVPTGAVLPPGRALDCGVAFEVPAGFVPAEITYAVDSLSASSACSRLRLALALPAATADCPASSFSRSSTGTGPATCSSSTSAESLAADGVRW